MIGAAAPGCAQIFGLDSPGLRDDAPPVGGDAGPFCYGRFAPAGVCFAHEPAGEVALLPAVSTDDVAACSQDLAMDIGACVIAARTVRVPAVTRVRGGRPLVLVATELVQVTGRLDVAGHLADGAGPGALASCAFGGVLSKQDGGAGGSDQALGGNGGVGGGGTDSGLAVAVAAPTSVRGGCAGQAGGADGVTPTGVGGGGGGAVWLIGGTIQLMGTIDASGAGGKGAQAMEQGGGGGGAGGMVVLDAVTLDVGAASATFADGGGGGAGASGTVAGGDGGESVGTAAAAGGTGPAGPGGAGGHGATLAGERGGDSGAGAGAGGGAAGWIFTSTAVAPGTFSPAPTGF